MKSIVEGTPPTLTPRPGSAVSWPSACAGHGPETRTAGSPAAPAQAGEDEAGVALEEAPGSRKGHRHLARTPHEREEPDICSMSRVVKRDSKRHPLGPTTARHERPSRPE